LIGLTLWMRSRIAGVEDQPERALALAGEAYEVGRQSGSVMVEALGLMYRGFFRLSLGETTAGLADQDHAAALALSSNIDPMTGGTLYCNILWACRTFNDWSRANQWTLGYQQFCHESGLQFSGACQLHRAEVLCVCGSLSNAVSHIEEAIAKLADDTPWAVGDAYRVLGDIQSALGDDEAAFEAYDKCETLGWDPEPGLAMLRLDRGDPAAARTGLERSLIGQSWWALQRRGLLRAHLAIVYARSSQESEALEITSDLLGQRERWPMPAICAFAEEANAHVYRRRGEVGEAARRLQICREIWTDIASGYHTARLRIELADLWADRGARDHSLLELRVARAAAIELGSRKLLTRCDAVQRRL
jgi:tetratricopeptide (TPR) repeat protein